MLLRPIAELASATAREKITFLYDALLEVVKNDNPGFALVAMPDEAPVSVPCREGRSLYAFVKRRSFRKRHSSGRLAGHNNGKDVTYYDDL